jgi:sugar lactone lactonase YvrE
VFRLTADLLVEAHAEVAEGPVWDDREGCLWWVDIPAGTLHRTDPASGDDRAIGVGQPLGAVALRGDGGLVAAVIDGLAVVDAETGALELRAPIKRDDPATRMNDGKPDPQGRFWGGGMAVDERAGAGVLYRVDRDWSVHPVLEDLTIPNGVGWSPDGHWLYFADTPTGRVDRFAFDAAGGWLGRREPFVLLEPGAGLPDGLTVDADGGVWIALWGGGGVARYDAEARFTGFVEVPVRQATCPTFGGPGLDTLFITTAREGFGPDGPPGEPHAGGLFACRPGMVGLPANRFRG